MSPRSLSNIRTLSLVPVACDQLRMVHWAGAGVTLDGDMESGEWPQHLSTWPQRAESPHCSALAALHSLDT